MVFERLQSTQDALPKLKKAAAIYKAETDLVDRMLMFRWTGNIKPDSGNFKLVKQIKNYPRKIQEPARKAASVER